MRRPFKKEGHRSAYIKKQEDVKREERDSQKHQQYIEAINSIANQFAAEQQQDNASDGKRAFREKVTISLLVATVVAAGIGDWFFYGQREEMAKAYEPLKVSSDAAKTSAQAAKDALEKAQRPFLYESMINFRAFKQGDAIWFGAAVQWENSGNTPTTKAEFELTCPSIPGPGISGKFNIVDPYALKKHIATRQGTIRSTFILGPNQKKYGGQCEFPVDDMVAAQSGKRTQYFIGQVKYTDIFGNDHTTRYCEYIYGIEGDVAGGGNTVLVNGPCLRHNCADEQCTKEDQEPELTPERLKELWLMK
jgi:hypothetical protein